MKLLSFFVSILLVAGIISTAHSVSSSVDESIRQDISLCFSEHMEIPDKTFKYQHEFEAAAEKYDLPLPFILSVSRGESFFDSAAVSSAGAIGLMQVMPGTAIRYGYSANDLKNPKKNIDAGVHYLKDLYDEFQDPYLTLAGYYCGENTRSLKNGSNKIRSDCDEYVRYIYTHFEQVMKFAKTGTKEYASAIPNFELADFRHISEVKNFMALIRDKVDGLKLDMFREETKDTNGIIIFKYKVLVSFKNGKEKSTICSKIEKETGFKFCK
ncbi:MAG: transglycosylase SLT domain-containing protein [Proteobacteria bacterium]|nr:lytic transglycosylase domain-containing protein [Desulfobacteraceae bacterium]MBU4012565.1 transglycosylase SLT domain-containing protein [Pseudomonadota bacterium]MBU4068317.1 transglycosylase SLT domain-containing protein [Pseudomonadota bacterium]MBU4099974.1 transglycosylase SLT domain-containing protein [Pseudomonadota bacterium]